MNPEAVHTAQVTAIDADEQAGRLTPAQAHREREWAAADRAAELADIEATS